MNPNDNGTFNPQGETMSVLRTLDELDQMQSSLKEEFPECKIGPVT